MPECKPVLVPLRVMVAKLFRPGHDPAVVILDGMRWG